MELHTLGKPMTSFAHTQSLPEDPIGELWLVANLAGPIEGSAGTIQRKIHGRLQMLLPEPMIPLAFAFMAALPMTPHGKTDWKALSVLPRPHVSSNTVERTLPQKGIEQALLEIWCEALKRESFGTTEDLSHLGGNSLSMMRAAVRLPRKLGINVPVPNVFQSSTIRSLGATIEDFQSTLHSDDERSHLLAEVEGIDLAERGE